MPNIPLAGSALLRALLLSALLVGVADADAKGKIRIGSNVGSGKSTGSKAGGDKDDDAKKGSGGYAPQINLRQSSSNTSSQPGSSLRGSGRSCSTSRTCRPWTAAVLASWCGAH